MPSKLMPNRVRAWIQPAKLTDYLLSATHAVGKSKAQFFRAHGYETATPDILERDLLDVAKNGELIDSSSSPFGHKYVVEGSIVTPRGARVIMRTVWIIESGDERPRFVTAYPA